MGTGASYKGQASGEKTPALMEPGFQVSESGSSEELIKSSNGKKGDARLDRVKEGRDPT